MPRKTKEQMEMEDEAQLIEPIVAHEAEAEWAMAEPPDEGEEEAEISPEEEKPYRLAEWGGMPQYQCNLCPWDTLKGEAAMLEHIATVHKPPAPQLTVLVADKRGREVKK